MNSKYDYSDCDRLATPNSYQYTRYEGEEFFSLFERSRQLVCDELKRRFKILSDVTYMPNNSIQEMNIDNGAINTCEVLSDIYKKGSIVKKDLDIIFKFLKKFEVSKKIYTSYSQEPFKKVSNNYKEIINYILLGNLILKCAISEKSISTRTIFFNAALKINDTICSVYDKIDSEFEACVVIENFNMENNLLKFYKENYYAL